MTVARFEIAIGGTVQGVGFRPFVFRTAVRLGIAGTVHNSGRGVVVIAQGPREALTEFVYQLRSHAPPLASITSFDISESAADPSLRSFTIIASRVGDSPTVDITRDSAPCDACLREMRNPGDRRYSHAFINCTDCGPRFTIIKSLPYDRERTTMDRFAMCAECFREFADPSSRRHHAQPVCCPNCGPRLELLDSQGKPLPCANPLIAAVDLLQKGAIVAIKGLGGFHLACRADSEEAVSLLRRRKRREEKPLAVMVADIESARAFADISAAEEKLLACIERPIVILDKKAGLRQIAPSVAPRVPTLGIMLPCTPLHHLLFDSNRFTALVMTSANISNEPLCCDNDEAVGRLAGIADAFLVHDRPIHVRIDDSVARELGGSAVLMRRARGYVPAPLPALREVQGIIGLGGIMKSSIAVGRGACCYVSHYLGSADTIETVENRSFALDHFLSILGVEPLMYVADLHPTAHAAASLISQNIPLIKVQHHHAHAAACLAENGIDTPAVCVVYDGLGKGDDDTIWGGEILIADTLAYTREAHLVCMPMPGGDAATRHPGRMAIGALYGLPHVNIDTICPWMPDEERRAIVSMLSNNLNCPLTSSMGRLFDSLAAMLGVCTLRTYEGQPAIELEGAADFAVKDSYDFLIEKRQGRVTMDGRRILLAAWNDFVSGTSAPKVAAKFHNTIAVMTVDVASIAAEKAKTDLVCLCGGCFQNRLLWQRTVSGLRRKGLHPVWHRVLPPSDEAVAFGQVVIAGRKKAASFS